jgi:RNA polymerase sigma-70 factor (ECF subfamily)
VPTRRRPPLAPGTSPGEPPRGGGEAEAAERFAADMLAHLDALYAFARWLARSPADAEDLVQETMLKGLRARASFEPGTNLRAWLFTILRRTFLNLDARAGRERPAGAAARGAEDPPAAERVPEPAVDPEPALFAAVSRDAIDAALAALPPEFREAVWLCDVEELTMSEAAAVIGCPVGTVKSRVSRGRAILRGSLKGYAG